MGLMPDAQTRAISNIQKQYRGADDPFSEDQLDYAVDAVLRRPNEDPTFLERNARRDGASLARKRKISRPAFVPLEDLSTEPACALPSAERELVFKGELRRLEQLLLQRSAPARQVLDCWAEDMSVTETATAMGLSVGRVKQLRRLVKAVALAGLQPPSSL